jgi:hypothetical protein
VTGRRSILLIVSMLALMTTIWAGLLYWKEMS